MNTQARIKKVLGEKMLYKITISGDYLEDNGQSGEEWAELHEVVVVEAAKQPTEQEILALMLLEPRKFGRTMEAVEQAESPDCVVEYPDIEIEPLEVLRLPKIGGQDNV